MTDNLPQLHDQTPNSGAVGPWSGPYDPDPFGAPEENEGISWRRYVSALGRQRWLIALMFLLGTAAASTIWFVIKPEYQATAVMWIDQPDDVMRQRGPIRSGGLLSEYAWVELLQSPRVLSPVVRSEKLFVLPESLSDSVALKDFDIGEEVWAGEYRISVDPSGDRYTLATSQGDVVDEGAVGDSVGRGLGFLWNPGGNVLSPGRRIDFTVISPGEAATRLARELRPALPEPGTFLSLTLQGEDPQRIARVVNAVASEHVMVAEDLKRKQADDLTAQLLQQRDRVYQDLESAEFAYEQFRVNTITEPTDRTIAIAPGLEATQGPIMSDYFDRQLRLQQVREDQRRIAQAVQGGEIRVAQLEVIPAVQASSQLMDALGDLTTQQAALRTLRARYTEIHPPVVAQRAVIDKLEQEVVPALIGAVQSGLAAEAGRMETDLQRASSDLRAIPQRTVQEDRLKRDLDAHVELFTEISNRYEQARLAAASTVPDVRIWTIANVPQFPMPDERLRLMLMVLGGALAAGVLGALLLDRMDPRVQYPEEVTSEMGLNILGAVPPIKRLDGRRGEENTEHVVEAFRELRLNLLYAYGSSGPGPLVITISSPGSGDGKSLITANLGVAFAELGRKTLIIDADTRRGDIHQLLGCDRKPGLTDYLAGEATRSEIINKTDYDSLDMISSGSRLTHAPELLGSVEMRDLFADLRTQYGVILVDSPPLGAGSDAFMLGTLTGNMVLVLRTGTTNKELTLARLAPLTRLPVRIVGAILNDVQPGGVYRYYSSYLPGYGTGDEVVGSTATNGQRAALGAPSQEVGATEG